MIVKRCATLLKVLSVLVFVSTFSCIWSRRTDSSRVLFFIPEESRQILLVRTPSWDAVRGTMDLYVRKGELWERDHEGIPVVVGRAGLAWGLGLHDEGLFGPQKREGDGHAPAGLYELGTSFGYDEHPPGDQRYPYRQATADDYFVDDVDSPDYNQWISLSDSAENDPDAHWRSYERMRRDDDLYELGIVVEHNMNPVRKGKGSAIFIHVWRGEGQPTAGCTAMSRSDMLRLLRWLDPARHPLLLQAPTEVSWPSIVGHRPRS